jgi:hypothetical protein
METSVDFDNIRGNYLIIIGYNAYELKNEEDGWNLYSVPIDALGFEPVFIEVNPKASNSPPINGWETGGIREALSEFYEK